MISGYRAKALFTAPTALPAIKPIVRAAYALTDLEPDPAACMAHAGPLLERLAARIAAAGPEFRERPA
ncbi:hypothetical protein AB0K60_09910 [Thermopolyspora sp. NPDC052614]|uniref:hypothetical protein n=1 Tax=Thermopolyspora sp. NPDC052614 TaxID=3155682 RepID=UPI003423AB5F